MSKWVVWFSWYPVVIDIEVPMSRNGRFPHTHMANRHKRVWLRFVARRWNPGFYVESPANRSGMGLFEYAPAWRAVTQ